MTWVTFDDGAPKHDKQLAAGAKACWLWTCGLAHCYRQNSQDGFIPETTVKALYPGLGKKEAEALVKVDLWEAVEGGYLIHDYLDWKERRFNGIKNARGVAGGSVSSEAKRQAALTREANKRLARQGTTPPQTQQDDVAQRNHNGVTTTTSPTATGSDSGSGIFDPVSSSDPDSDPEQSESFSYPPRPNPRPALMAVRVEAKAYEPLDSHWAYAVALRLTQAEVDSALRDLRDKFGGKKHDEPWLDDKLCAFLEQVSKSKHEARRPGRGGPETPAERRTREQLERVARLEAAERAAAQGAGQ